MVILRVHGGILEVNLFLVKSHFTDGTFDSACEGGHGKGAERHLCFFFGAHAAFLLDVTVENWKMTLRIV